MRVWNDKGEGRWEVSMGADGEQAQREIYLAGGCFWGTQGFMRQLPGVTATDVGYANSSQPNPTYEQVCSSKTNAVETVRVAYDPHVIPLPLLLKAYFASIDPTHVNHQGNDVGPQYRTGIYWVDDADEAVVRDALAELQRDYAAPIAVEALPLENYYPAEAMHQDYLLKHPNGYCHVDLSLARRFAEEHGLA